MKVLKKDVTFEITHDEAKALHELLGNIEVGVAEKIISKKEYELLCDSWRILDGEFKSSGSTHH